MPPAARITDPVVHPLPPVLTGGPPAPTVLIGYLPAWLGIPPAAGPGLMAAQAATEALIQTAETAAQVAEAAAVAAAPTPGGPAAAAAATAARLTAETLKASTAASMGASITAAAAGGASIHACVTPWPIPPHGPGVVIDGSPTVTICFMAATRQGDTIIEAIGPPNKIAMGCPTVMIGNSGSGGASGGAGGGAGAAGGAAAGAGAAAGEGAAAGAGAGTGKKKNGPFDSADDAARAALKEANPQSIKDNTEYSGLIYKGADGKFYYTGPAKGTDQGANPLKDAPAPAGTTTVGDYHTHGDYSTVDPVTGAAVRTNDPAKDQLNSDNFSSQDKKDNDKQHYPGYLGTPSGTFRKYDPADGSDTVL